MEENSDCFVDEEMEPDPELNRITNGIIGAAIEVHRELGPGQLESAYEAAMAYEMSLRGIRFERQLEIELMYKGHPVGRGRLDFLVEGKSFSTSNRFSSSRRSTRRKWCPISA